MDLVTLGIFGVCFVVCLALVALVFVVGTKEQTYEDGIRLSREKFLSDSSAKKKAKHRKKSPDAKPNKKGEPTTQSTTVEHAGQPLAAATTKPSADVEEEEVAAPQEEPVAAAVESSGVTLTAAGRVKNKQKKRMTVEEIETRLSSVDPKPSPPKVPVNEPLIVKEEAVLLYNGEAGGGEESGQEKAKKAKKVASNPEPLVAKKPQLHAQDLLSAVKKTTFDVDELQDLIDILLNKQQGSGAGHGGWVEQGGQVSEVKNLEKALGEMKAELTEEFVKVKSVTERYHQVRQELNLKTQQLNTAQRDIQSRHRVQVQTLESRLQQEIDLRHHEVARLQQQIQYHLHARLQEEGQVKTELEQSKKSNASLEMELSTSRSQANAVQKDLTQLKGELSQAKEESRGWELKCDNLAKPSSKEAITENLLEAQNKLEAQLKDAKQKLKSSGEQISSLSEENERLSEQLALAVERPKADGQESVCNGSNGDIGASSDKQSSSAGSEQKALQLRVESENKTLREEVASLAKKEVEKARVVEELSSKLEIVTGDLKSQRTKNDELRCRNWKAVEALNNVEQSYQSLLKAQHKVQQQPSSFSPSELKAAAEKERTLVESSQKKFLARLFPEMELDDGKSMAFTAWLDGFESKVNAHKSGLKKGSSGSCEETEDLKKQVQKYKSVLNETESVLHTLQSSVETVESGWREKVADKQKEVDSLRLELDGLSKTNLAVQKSLNVVNSAEEMQDRLRELQRKLAEEEEEKERLAKELKQNLEEKVAAEKELQSESTTKADLGLQVAKLNQVITTGQEALQQEQKTVELLRELLAKHEEGQPQKPANEQDKSAAQETAADGNAKTPTMSISSSKVGSVGSLDLPEGGGDPASGKDKKSSKKKLFGLIKKSK